jgi:hypothetical protein
VLFSKYVENKVKGQFRLLNLRARIFDFNLHLYKAHSAAVSNNDFSYVDNQIFGVFLIGSNLNSRNKLLTISIIIYYGRALILCYSFIQSINVIRYYLK